MVKPRLRCDLGPVNVLVEATGAIEAGAERTRAGTAGLRVASHVRTVIIGGGIGRPHRVALVGPHCADHVSLRINSHVVAEERHPATAELLIVEVRWRAGHFDARSPSVTAVRGLGAPDIQARGRLAGGAVTRWLDGGVF